MSQIKSKNVELNGLTGAVIRLLNLEWLRGRNAADDADVNIVRVNASDRVEFGSVPQVSSDPSANNDLVRKSWIDTQLGNKINTSARGAANGVASLDADGLVPITQMPPAAIERLTIVADQAARYALTTATVQNGDTVKQSSDGLMFFVVDDTKLDQAAGYEAYTVGSASSVPWSGVTGKPTTLAGYGITDYAAAAKAAAVSDSISDAVTDVAPSQNAVFDALALKQNNITFGKETKTLVAQDITNQYIDLAQTPKANSLRFIFGGLEQVEGTDYTVTGARVAFIGDIATGGGSALVTGDKVHFAYVY